MKTPLPRLLGDEHVTRREQARVILRGNTEYVEWDRREYGNRIEYTLTRVRDGTFFFISIDKATGTMATATAGSESESPLYKKIHQIGGEYLITQFWQPLMATLWGGWCDPTFISEFTKDYQRAVVNAPPPPQCPVVTPVLIATTLTGDQTVAMRTREQGVMENLMRLLNLHKGQYTIDIGNIVRRPPTPTQAQSKKLLEFHLEQAMSIMFSMDSLPHRSAYHSELGEILERVKELNAEG
jgi:hypothetical protein